MTIPTKQQAYGSSTGTTPVSQFYFRDRDPTSSDTAPVYQLYSAWVNTTTHGIWYLEDYFSSGGVTTSLWRAVAPIVTNATTSPTTTDYQYPIGQTWVNETNNSYWVLTDVTGTTATWIQISGGGGNGIDSITGNSGGAVFGDASNNVGLVGTAPVSVTGNPGAHTLTVAITGGAFVEEFIPDTGTSPVVPNASGQINVMGQNPANVSGIRVTGGTNELDISMFSPFSSASSFQFISTGGVRIEDHLYVGLAAPTNPVDMNIDKSDAGGNVEVEIRNSSNAASSNAILGIVAGSSGGGATAGDPFVTYNLAGIQNWSHGIDNSDSDKFKIAASNSLGSTDVITCYVAGSVTKPLQPAFLATSTVAQANSTGAGTNVTVLFTTEVFDQQSNYNTGTSTFTAPVTGKYRFSVSCEYDNLTVLMTSFALRIITTARTYQSCTLNIGNARNVSNTCIFNNSVLADMTAGDTCYIQTVVNNGAADTVSIGGDATTTYFSGELVC